MGTRTMGTRAIGGNCRQFDSMKLSERQVVGVPKVYEIV